MQAPLSALLQLEVHYGIGDMGRAPVQPGRAGAVVEHLTNGAL